MDSLATARAEYERVQDEIHAERKRFRQMSDEQLIRAKNSKHSTANQKRLAIANLAARNGGRAPQGRMTQLQVRIPKDLKSELEKGAALCKMSTSDFVRMAVRNELAEIVK